MKLPADGFPNRTTRMTDTRPNPLAADSPSPFTSFDVEGVSAVPLGTVVPAPQETSIGVEAKTRVTVCGRGCSQSKASTILGVSLLGAVVVIIALIAQPGAEADEPPAGPETSTSGGGAGDSTNQLPTQQLPPPQQYHPNAAPDRSHVACNQTLSGTTAGYASLDGQSGAHQFAFSLPPTGGHLVNFNSCGSEYSTFLRVLDSTMVNMFAACGGCGPCGDQTVLDAQLTCTTASAEYSSATQTCDYVFVIEGYAAEDSAYSVTMVCEDSALDHEGSITCGQHVTGSTVDASNSYGSVGGDHLYSFTVGPTSQLVQFDACLSTYDTYLRVYSTDMFNELHGCDDCGECGLQTVLDAELAPGDYVLVIEGYYNEEGDYDVIMNCPNGTEVSGFLDGTITVDTPVSGSTVASGSHVGNGASDHIYSFSLSGEYAMWYIEFNSCGSQFDTWLRIFDSDLEHELAGCDDCGPCGTRTVLDAVLAPGNYFVVVEGWNTAEGYYEITMSAMAGPSLATMPHIECTGAAVTGSTVGAGSQFGNGAGEMLYFFSIPESLDSTSAMTFTPVTFNSCGSNYDTYLWITSMEDAIVQLHGCDDCGSCGLQTILEVDLLPGDYILVVEGFASMEGAYTVDMTCNAPVNIGQLDTIQCGQTVTGDTSTSSGTNLIPGGSSPENLFAFSIPSLGLVQFNSCGSQFDTWLRVVAPSFGEEFESCDDCGSCGLQTVLDLDLPAGEYVLVVEGFADSQGAYQVTMSCSDETQGFLDGTLECGTAVSGTTVTAGNHLGNGAADHIYEFQVDTDGTYEFDSCCSQFDTWLRIFRGTEADIASVANLANDGDLQCGNDVQVGCEVYGCDDCRPCGTQSVLQTNLTAGPYLLVVEGARHSLTSPDRSCLTWHACVRRMGEQRRRVHCGNAPR